MSTTRTWTLGAHTLFDLLNDPNGPHDVVSLAAHCGVTPNAVLNWVWAWNGPKPALRRELAIVYPSLNEEQWFEPAPPPARPLVLRPRRPMPQSGGIEFDIESFLATLDDGPAPEPAPPKRVVELTAFLGRRRPVALTAVLKG